MNYLLYQLRFNTPVHFGSSDSALSLYMSDDHFRADTLFSALCHTALQIQGEEGLIKLVSMVKTGSLLFSDSMPWMGEHFYLPKPCFAAQTDRELPTDKRKVIKKLAWIPINRIDEYCSALKSGELFLCDIVSFGKNSESIKASVPEEGDSRPFPVGLFHFKENCGLYFIAALENMQELNWLSELVSALGLSGIGGKVTAGYGKFSVISVINLSQPENSLWSSLSVQNSNDFQSFLLLTTSLPRDDELESALEDGYFRLVRRAGFVASDQYAQTPQKKLTQFFIGAGAVLKHNFSGELYEIGDSTIHPVWRYAKPLFLGVNL